jgi:hypothetical protein
MTTYLSACGLLVNQAHRRQRLCHVAVARHCGLEGTEEASVARTVEALADKVEVKVLQGCSLQAGACLKVVWADALVALR